MIHTLSSDAFAGVLKAPKVTGLSPLFRAKIRVNGDSVRCYVKPLPDMLDCPVRRTPVNNQEVISEALGYVLAKACGFKVPTVAGIILLEQEQIPESALAGLRSLGRGRLQPNYFCWFTKDMVYPNLVQKHMQGVQLEFLKQRRLRRLVKHLAEAEDTPKVVAFDDWLLNSDRHPGNLLASNDNLMLIDHGRIFVYPNWQPGTIGSLGSGHQPGNRLRNFIDSYEPNWSAKLPKKSQMIMAYNAFAVGFRDRGEGAARAVLAEFFDNIDIDAIIHLLQSRHDPAAYAKESGMVL
ncbi:hypothetical protein HMPREF1224_06097 [Pseudomonas sp. P179]|uniref:hypothetical protein n=1 Tax=Pseudomonas sp. P179 TaxID=1125698 RepID=UPI0002C93E8A|nr:hypothetical protein [Pseudomonas sp. P179]EMZ58558.1 hypothetical protein HMPREF1224_06097 [Pseudomonas sp. P179]MDP5612725.1 hypothetical protein [Pseudomonas aeruginosa]